MLILRIALTIFVLYVIFLLGPSIVMYFRLFVPRSGTPYEERNLRGTYLEKHRERIREDSAYFKTQKCEEVKVISQDGVRLYGEFYGENHSEVVLCVHGYLSTPLNCFSTMGKFLLEDGYGVLLIHQRGNGKSEGRRGGFGLIECNDLSLWIRSLRERGAKHIFLAGMSMGSATICYASPFLEQPPVAGMILCCGFVSPYRLLSDACDKKHLPTRLLLPHIEFLARWRLKIDLKETTDASLERNRIPSLFVHGTEDASVPLSDSRSHYEHCSAEKRLCIVEGAGHSDLFLIGEDAGRAVKEFVEQHSERRMSN